jgi:hypothetical protein
MGMPFEYIDIEITCVIQVEVNEQQIRNLFILNSGKFNFDYNWELNMATKRKDMVTITPMSGGVNHGERKKCILSFCPSARMTLRDSELALKVKFVYIFTNVLVTSQFLEKKSKH